MLTRFTSRLNATRPYQSFLIAIGLCSVVFAATADWTSQLNPDVEAAALPAWRFATHGDVYIDDPGINPWFVERNGRWVSDRPPGASLLALPFYWLSQADPVTPSYIPSTLTAVVATSLAMGFLQLSIRPLLTVSQSLLGVMLFAFGTATWPISSVQLWQHGPAQMWLALATLSLAVESYGVAGIAFGWAILTRPITAVMAAVAGILVAFGKRSVKPLIVIGLGSLIGLAVLTWFNQAVFGTTSPIGGYSPEFASRLATTPWADYGRNLIGTFFGPLNGLIIWSPVIAVLIAGIPSGWRVAPNWVQSTAIASLAYVLVHARLNRYSGGLPVDYRYPLEPLILAAPLLALSFREWVAKRPIRIVMFAVTAVWSIAAQALVALAFSCTQVVPDTLIYRCNFF